MKMKSNCQAIGKTLFLGLVLVLVLTACGKSVNELKDAGDVQGLISVLGDADEKGCSRKDAAFVLGEIDDPTAVEPLIRYMQACAEGLDAGRASMRSDGGVAGLLSMPEDLSARVLGRDGGCKSRGASDCDVGRTIGCMMKRFRPWGC